jgi:signal transduction histidine kinase
VELRARCQPDAVSIEVADSGPGIPAAVMPMIFEPFYSMKASGQGTGLGLVICRDLVEKQGGTITVANQPEGGAMFTVQLPLMPFGKAKG